MSGRKGMRAQFFLLSLRKSGQTDRSPVFKYQIFSTRHANG
ncbi:hypothetical protein NBRC3257_0992 [Gluconobacter thailandicus NBRC 3257]|uniref:Transposase n=1 Tax=Gluconobacter thailandicus NBRC 3257 TaxID=1381097 RepID=A0ABQ0IUV0_GLUTH|nr:hypothetical protein NBRC3255_0093 [Gluconobacter thailandicus NBRC 3255]GAD25993.1 hypothetical protein NBRC3257_0992 [Gluconobacter thailandicus NBRC 3257]